MHLTTEQLNEYLDHETKEREVIESHLASCTDCAERLAALESLFEEIESLPELALSRDLAATVIGRVSERAALPRSLRLTMTLEAVAAIMVIVFAAPFVMRSISSYLAALPAPSLATVLLQVETQWQTWLEALSQFRVPAIPEIPVVELSSLFLSIMVVGVSLLWLIGNGLLLRNKIK